MREELLRRILLHHLALIHEKYTGGHLAGKAHLMSNHYHGHTIVCQFLHNRKNLSDHLRIQRRCRLVEQHHIRVHRKRARNRDTLLLAAGELRGISICLIGETDTRQQFLRSLICLLLRHLSEEHRRQRNVLARLSCAGTD